MNVETITLDAAGTLIKPAEPVATTYQRLARNHGAELDTHQLGLAFGQVFHSMPPMAFAMADADTLDRLERGWWRALVRRVTDAAGGVPEFDGYFEELYEYYRSGRAWQLYDEVESVLSDLRAAGKTLAVISNFDSRLVDVLDALGVSGAFERIAFSTGARAAKPDPRIFESTLESLQTRPDRALHAGDSLLADYRGARDAGLGALLITRSGPQRLAGAPAGEEATDLRALVERAVAP